MGQSSRIALEQVTKTIKPMKTVNIKGKEYVEVNERIKHFRANYTKHALTTEIVELTDKRVVMVAKVIDAGGVVISTGHAYEDKDSTFINKTSYIENCETSAIGRALGNFGIGIDTSIASAEEVQMAIANQNPATSIQIEDILILLGKAPISEVEEQNIRKKLHVFSKDDAVKCINYLNTKFKNQK